MYRKNVAGQFCAIQGVDTTTGGIKSGVTWTIRRCIDGTFAAATGTATEDGTTGWYKFAMSQADTNGNNVEFNFTGTGAVPQTVNCIMTAADPTDTVRFGLTALPNAAAEAAGGLYTRGSGTGQINQTNNGNVDVRLADAVSHGGTLGSSTATLALSRINVTSQSSNTTAVTLLGNGTGHGLSATSGSGVTGNGIAATSGATNGSGFALTGTGTGSGLLANTVGVTSTVTVSGTTSLAAVTTSGTVTLNALTVSNALLVSGTTTLSGAVSLGSTLGVTGATTLTGTVTATDAANDIRLGSTQNTAVATAVWATVMTGSTTAIQSIRGFIAVLLGKVSGLSTGVPAFRNIADNKDVIAATTDADGNRTSVTLDLT